MSRPGSRASDPVGLETALERFPPRMLLRGRDYAAQGRVALIAVEPDRIRAAVRGTSLYQGGWTRTLDRWTPTCTCPVAPECKHAVAVIQAALAAGDASIPRPARGVRPTPALRQLRVSGPGWAREQALAELLHGHPIAPLVYANTFAQSLAESDPDLRCWRVAREVARRASGWLPPALEPYRDRPDLAERVQARTRAEVTNELRQWVRWRQPVVERRLRLVFSLRHAADGPIVVAVAHVTSPRVDDAPRTTQQLRQLAGEVRRDPRLLSPREGALLAWLCERDIGGSDHAAAIHGALPDLLARVADSSIAVWSDDVPPDLATLAGITPGDGVRFAADAVQLLPTCVARDGRPWVRVAVVWPDGRSRPLERTILIDRHDPYAAGLVTGLVLVEGTFFTVTSTLPAKLARRLDEADGLPLDPAEPSGLLTLLADRFPHVRATMASHTRVHPVAMIVAVDLRDDDWVQLRVLACTGPWRPGDPIGRDTVVFEYGPDGAWTRLAPATSDGAFDAIGAAPAVPAPAEPNADAWLEAPDASATAPVVAWLDTTSARPLATNDGPPGVALDQGWWIRPGRRAMDALAEAWEARPDGVTFFGTPRVRRVLDKPVRGGTRVRVEQTGLDWLAVSADWAAEGAALTTEELGTLRAAKTRFVRLASGWVRRDVVEEHDRAAALLADLGVDPDEPAQRVTMWQLAGARSESLRALEELGDDAGTTAAIAELRDRVATFEGLPPLQPPSGLRATLRPYQQQGLEFLAWTSSLGLGAILADDMGLGKTVQALAWLAHLRERDPDGGPSLVVCPASVVHNWRREAERFTPALRVTVLERGAARHSLRDDAARYDVLVTNYALLRQDVAAWKTLPLRALVLDEGQNVKNPDAAVTRAAQSLTAKHRVALTGTPLENRALDLWSIMSVVNPGYLGSRTAFVGRYDRADAPAHVRTLLAARLRPVMLRRLKREVARDLPDRIEERRDCELSTGQRKLYLAELSKSRRLVQSLATDDGGLRKHRIDILAALTRLLQVGCLPALFGAATSVGSGKFDALLEVLEPLLAEGHKVLVFSQFVECLKLIAEMLQFKDIPHHMLTGSTVKRDAVVSAFTADERASVFLVSLRAGGTGLNLTAASYVVLFDPWWNPAVEAQAIDRTHRIGQDRTVIAFRLIARGTIEEKIWELQQRKAALVRDVLGEGGFGRALTRDDLEFLLDPEDEE
jgi:superfamily II DNA or RNA helicase